MIFWKKAVSPGKYFDEIVYYRDLVNRGEFLPSPCASEILPTIDDFFKKCLKSKVNWKNSSTNVLGSNFSSKCVSVTKIAEIALFLSGNTRSYDKLSKEEVDALKKLVGELDSLRKEVLSTRSSSNTLKAKINCISEVIEKNAIGMHDSAEKHLFWRDGMIFQNYVALYKVVHRINVEWNELCNRGFSINVFYDFWEYFKYTRRIKDEMRESEKLDVFMALLDGKKKFVPIYERKAVCFAVVDADFEGVLNKEVKSKYENAYQLRLKDEK